jgi:4-hydroxy-tetrahydrodipicolinate reductase
MIVTAQRLVNAVPAVVAAKSGLVSVLDLPLITGRGLVSGSRDGRQSDLLDQRESGGVQ